MKRKVNDFEKKLIEKGWTLHSKVYFGKGSKSVLCYTYTKKFESIFGEVQCYCDYRKCDDKILNISFDNIVGGIIDSLTIDGIKTLWDKVNSEIMNCKELWGNNGEIREKYE